MIHYTVLPNEMVFEDEDEPKSNERVVDIDGVQLIVQPQSDMEYKIVQLISSDPMQFMNPRYQPGNTVPIKPQFD